MPQSWLPPPLFCHQRSGSSLGRGRRCLGPEAQRRGLRDCREGPLRPSRWRGGRVEGKATPGARGAGRGSGFHSGDGGRGVLQELPGGGAGGAAEPPRGGAGGRGPGARGPRGPGALGRGRARPHNGRKRSPALCPAGGSDRRFLRPPWGRAPASPGAARPPGRAPGSPAGRGVAPSTVKVRYEAGGGGAGLGCAGLPARRMLPHPATEGAGRRRWPASL